jgi:hypothetical protein
MPVPKVYVFIPSQGVSKVNFPLEMLKCSYPGMNFAIESVPFMLHIEQLHIVIFAPCVGAKNLNLMALQWHEPW